MDTRQHESVDALRRFQSALDRYADLLGNLNETPPRRELDQLLAKLDAAAVEHEQLRIRKEGETQRKKELREILINDHMLPIVKIKELNRNEMIRIIALAMPRPHANDTALGITARAMADLAGKHRDAFVRDGLPVDFVEQLLAAERAFLRARLDRDSAHLNWLNVTRLIEFDLNRAWVVVDAIKALVRKALRHHPEIRAEFRRALLHRPRPALTAPAAQAALPRGEAPEAVKSTALVQAEPPKPEPGDLVAPRPRISAWARVIALIKPAA